MSLQSKEAERSVLGEVMRKLDSIGSMFLALFFVSAMQYYTGHWQRIGLGIGAFFFLIISKYSNIRNQESKKRLISG